MKKFTLTIALLGLVGMQAYSQNSREILVKPKKGINLTNEYTQQTPGMRGINPSVAVTYSDDFSQPNDTTGLQARGYLTYYRGTGIPGTSPTWFQGDSVGYWPAYNGLGDSYVVSDYNSVTTTNDIDNWLVLPALNIAAGDVISFWSRTFTNSTFPDSVKVMYSAVGDSTPEDLSWVQLGNFKVNTTGNWLQNSFAAPTAGATARFAIRYAVVGGGPTGANSNAVGIDQLEVSTPPASDAGVTAINNIPAGCGLSASTPITITISNFGASTITGFPVSYTINAGTPVTETYTGSIATLSNGTYTFTATANLSATGSYTINAYTTVAGDANAANDASNITTANTASIQVLTGTPFVEGFESVAVGTVPPLGWTLEDTDGDLNIWDFINTYPHSGTMAARLGVGNPVAAPAENWMFTPCLDLLAGTNYVIEYYYKSFTNTLTSYELETRFGTGASSAAMTNNITVESLFPDSSYHYAAHIFTVPASGTYYVGFNGFGSSIDNSLRVEDITISVSTGINEVTNENNLLVGPNPSNGMLNVSGKVAEDNMQLVVTNYLGQPVYSAKFNQAFKTQLDLSKFATGVYAVQLITSKGAITKTITLQTK